jgi:hypothetical protein
MHYEGNIIRPPSEANSILLQVSVGCSRNKCTFCGTYTGERFRIKPDSIIEEDIDFTLNRIVTLFEPLILVLMGLVIAGLLLSVYYPLLRLVTTIA